MFTKEKKGGELPDTKSAGGEEGSPGAPFVVGRNEREIRQLGSGCYGSGPVGWMGELRREKGVGSTVRQI